LIPCVECQRHIRARESACPFCGARARENGGTRFQVAAVAAVAAVALVGCQNTEVTTTTAPTEVVEQPTAEATQPPAPETTAAAPTETAQAPATVSVVVTPAAPTAVASTTAAPVPPPKFNRPMVARYGVAPRRGDPGPF
jgi:hypothetical protein